MIKKVMYYDDTSFYFVYERKADLNYENAFLEKMANRC